MSIIAFRNGLAAEHEKKSFICQGLTQVFALTTADDVVAAFAQVNAKLKNNQVAVFAFNYEASCLFDSHGSSTPQGFIWIFNRGHSVTAGELDSVLTEHSPSEVAGCTAPVPTVTESEYCDAIADIRHRIREGEIYQLNYTFPMIVETYGDPAQLFVNLAKNQPTTNAVYIDTEELMALSWSPEMFVTVKDDHIEVRPMKGTAPRGKTDAEDQSIIAQDLNSPKNQAENVMIVDLMRNDLSQVAESGTVQVTKLFEVETYPSLHQLTSTVTAKLKTDNLFDIFKALFPSGSITGAPKHAAMQAIAEIEKYPRGLYTGSIGLIQQGQVKSNVAIRTLVLKHQGQYHVGSGIIWDSDAKAEYAECLLKASFLCRNDPGFQLFETIKSTATDSRVVHHRNRMEQAATRLGFKFDQDQFDAVYQQAKKNLQSVSRIKITLYHSGKIESQTTPMDETPDIANVVWALDRTDSTNLLLQFKTTVRDIYDTAYQWAEQHGAFDALFVNQHGEVTEGSRTNIFIKTDAGWLTPPLSAGALPGILREELLRTGQAREQQMNVDDVELASAQGRLHVGNSLRGLIPARFV